jgi:orotidine-5'-phosphate decarboxylase
MNGPKLIVALDVPDEAQALALAGRLSPALCRLKVGLELYTACGPSLIARLSALGYEIFLDLKFHDIPATVARACERAASLGAWMMNVHCLGGEAMLRAAREAVNQAAGRKPLLIGVTWLTSSGPGEMAQIGMTGSPEDLVGRLAGLARRAGLDGVVCSAREARRLRAAHGKDFVLVTPGIRPAGVAADDQQRTLTPAEAVAAGADYLVIGRPVTRAPDPLAALKAIDTEIERTGLSAED